MCVPGWSSSCLLLLVVKNIFLDSLKKLERKQFSMAFRNRKKKIGQNAINLGNKMRNLHAGRYLYPNLCWLVARGSLCGITPQLHDCLSRGLSSVQKRLAEAPKPPSLLQDLFFLGHSHRWRFLVDQASIETRVRRKARRCLGL